MKTITVRNIEIQFDTTDDGADQHNVLNMIESINECLNDNLNNSQPQILMDFENPVFDITDHGIYNSNEILGKYGKLSDSEKLEIMNEAIEYMSQHNGRSKYDCIILAMGYVYDDETDNGEPLYKKK